MCRYTAAVQAILRIIRVLCFFYGVFPYVDLKSNDGFIAYERGANDDLIVSS